MEENLQETRVSYVKSASTRKGLLENVWKLTLNGLIKDQAGTVLLTIFHWQWTNQIQKCKAHSSPLCKALLWTCHIQRSSRKTKLFTSLLQPPKSHLPPWKSSAHWVNRVVTTPKVVRRRMQGELVQQLAPATPWALKFLILQKRWHESSTGTELFPWITNYTASLSR